VTFVLQWRRVVVDGLATDDVDITMTCKLIIIVALYIVKT